MYAFTTSKRSDIWKKIFLFSPGIVPEISRLFMSVNTNVVFFATWTLSNLDQIENKKQDKILSGSFVIFAKYLHIYISTLCNL